MALFDHLRRWFPAGPGIFLLLVALGLPLRSLAVEWECRWTPSPPRLDGTATEAEWSRAQVITNFAQPWKSGRGTTLTQFRLMWDRDFLYFYSECTDADLVAPVAEHDGRLWEHDVVEIFLKPASDKAGYYEFEFNPANAVFDMFIPSPGGDMLRHVTNGVFHIETAVQLQGTLNQRGDKDRGWSVEGRIPWRDFLRTGGRPQPGEFWACNLARVDDSSGMKEPELLSAAPLTEPNFHQVDHYASLKFLPPEPGMLARGMTNRPAWEGSRIKGSPEPPAQFKVTPAFPGLKTTLPLQIVNEPGSDRLLLIEHTQLWGGTTKIRRFRNDPSVNSAEDFLEMDGFAYGIAFDPGFKTNGFFYVGCNQSDPGQPKLTRAIRYAMSRQEPFGVLPGSRLVIIEWASDGHNGGDVCFGRDGMLYVTSGDGTSDSDANVVGQDLTKLTAKVLRVDVRGATAQKPYQVPADNPFVGQEGIRPETWAYGLRNPWRITSDLESGQIWVGENGQDLWEYARLLQKGANYGWSVFEGSHSFYKERKLGPHPVVFPTIEHSHAEFRSLTGGVVYRGAKHPSLRGAYVYGDYSTGKIWAGLHDGTSFVWRKELVDTSLDITGFGTDQNGEILVVGHTAGIHRLDANTDSNPQPPFPRKLSETGLFTNLQDPKAHPAMIPYSVNSPVWTDGSYKQRWIALPNADSKIDFTSNRGWGFPDGTVLVQTLGVELETRNPSTRHRIETRILTRQQGEWAGYTYVWNESQTEAELLGAEGGERRFKIKDSPSSQSTRELVWRYPSRGECMVCHSRAANYVLGLTEAQLNRDYTFPNGVDNQLKVLEELGVLRVQAADYDRDACGRELGVAKLDPEAQRLERVGLQQESGQRDGTVGSLLPRSPERMRKLANPYDSAQPLEARVRAYLQGNCAHCHVEAGGGNSQMDFDHLTSREGMKILDVKPVHSTFGAKDARIVAPGAPQRSVMFFRISHRGDGHMPPLGTTRVDVEAVQLFMQWMQQVRPVN